MAKSKTKATSVKKAVKSNKKRLSLKNLDFKKNWKKLSYLGLAGFLAFSSVGYGIWNNSVQDEASAFSTTNWEGKTIATTNGASYINLCREITGDTTTTVRFKMVKIGSDYEKFAISTTGSDYTWSSSTPGEYTEKELYSVDANSLFTTSIVGPVNSARDTMFVSGLTVCD